MRSRLERLAHGPDAELAVATAVRVAVSHYLVRSDDDDEFLTQLRHAARVKAAVTIPATIEDLTPAWFTEILVSRSRRRDPRRPFRHHRSGPCRLKASSDLPDTVFVKLQPFVARAAKVPAADRSRGRRGAALRRGRQRSSGAGAARVALRLRRSDGAFMMVLEDLEASGCRFISPSDDDILDVATSLVDELGGVARGLSGPRPGVAAHPVGYAAKARGSRNRRPASAVHRLGARSVRRRHAAGLPAARGTLRGALAGHRRVVQRGRAHAHPRRHPQRQPVRRRRPHRLLRLGGRRPRPGRSRRRVLPVQLAAGRDPSR